MNQLWNGTEEYIYYVYRDDGIYVKIDKNDYDKYGYYPFIVFAKKKLA
jgi:hypothetical protein